MPSAQAITFNGGNWQAGPDGQARTNDLPGTAPLVIFETNFENDTGFVLADYQLWNTATKPWGFEAAKATVSSRVETVPGQGVGGSNAMYFNYADQQDPVGTQPTISLFKHLTGDKATGFSELYIRYKVKLPDNFKAGPGVLTQQLAYWKWGRLWQNTGTTNDGTWTENREDSKYIVWNWNGRLDDGFNPGISFGANTGVNLDQGSNNGERARITWYERLNPTAPANWDNIFPMDRTTNIGFVQSYTDGGSEDYHTIEYRFVAATSDTAQDGIVEIWLDGVKQATWTSIATLGGATPDFTGIPTAVDGSGWNAFVLFDNLTEWNENWGDSPAGGGIYLNDVVVATSRIGHDYVAGNTDI